MSARRSGFWPRSSRAPVLLLGAIVVAVLLRRASAASRHLVRGMGIVTVLVLPLVSIALPWRLAVVPLEPAVTLREPVPAATRAPVEPGHAVRGPR